MIASKSRSVPKPTHGIFICRAELEEIETVHDAVWKLAKASATAAQWPRAAFYPYIATDSGSSTLQAKTLFLARLNPAADRTSADGDDNSTVGVGGLVGFAAFSAIMTVGAGESTLENMAVAGAWQRKGIGSRLLASGLLWCRAHAAATVFLEVRASNRVAIALYERTGFSAVGNRPGYYREPAEDGLQMQKALGLAARAG